MTKITRNIRTNILKITYKAKSSHIGSCLSIVEILSVLYGKVLKKKDRFILSKGHAALALYCTLFEKKFISLKVLNSFGFNKTVLMNHVSHKVKGVEFSTGSLGHGLPVAVGKALKFKINKENNKVFILISDGELNEGTTWESLLFASHHKLDNLNIIVDYNKICLLYTSDAADDSLRVDLGGRRIIKKIFFKQKTAYEIGVRLVGSEMCIRDSGKVYCLQVIINSII